MGADIGRGVGAGGATYHTAVPRPALFLVLALLALLPACGWREEPVGARAELYPVEVADATGTPLVIQAEPQVIASFDPDATAMVEALGYEGRVVELEDVKDDEAIDAAAADLYLVPITTSDDDVARIQRLGGAPVFRYGAFDYRYDDVPRLVARLGLALGRGPEGVDLARTLGAEIRASLARAEDAGTSRVLLDGGGLFTALGPETEYGQLLATVGAESIVPQTTMLRFSALERADPDAWVLTEESTTTAEELRDPTSPLADIRAVAEGRIFELDPTRFGVTPELPRAIDELVAALHAPAVPLPEVTQPEDTETGTGTEPDESGTEGTGTGAG